MVIVSLILLFTLCFIAPSGAKEASYSIRAICEWSTSLYIVRNYYADIT